MTQFGIPEFDDLVVRGRQTLAAAEVASAVAQEAAARARLEAVKKVPKLIALGNDIARRAEPIVPTNLDLYEYVPVPRITRWWSGQRFQLSGFTTRAWELRPATSGITGGWGDGGTPSTNGLALSAEGVLQTFGYMDGPNGIARIVLDGLEAFRQVRNAYSPNMSREDSVASNLKCTVDDIQNALTHFVIVNSEL